MKFNKKYLGSLICIPALVLSNANTMGYPPAPLISSPHHNILLVVTVLSVLPKGLLSKETTHNSPPLSSSATVPSQSLSGSTGSLINQAGIISSLLSSATSNRRNTSVHRNDNLLATFYWEQVGATIDGESDEDYFGESVAISADGKRILIGAPGNNGSGSISGHARVYQEVNGAWSQVGGDIDGEPVADQSVAFAEMIVGISADGKRIIVGAPLLEPHSMMGTAYTLATLVNTKRQMVLCCRSEMTWMERLRMIISVIAWESVLMVRESFLEPHATVRTA